MQGGRLKSDQIEYHRRSQEMIDELGRVERLVKTIGRLLELRIEELGSFRAEGVPAEEIHLRETWSGTEIAHDM